MATVAKMKELSRRLASLCREAEEIRERLTALSKQPSFWPERRRLAVAHYSAKRRRSSDKP